MGLVDSTKMHSFYFAILCNQIAFSFDIRYVLIIVSKHWQSIVLSFSNVFRKRFLLMPSFFQVLDTKTTQLNQKKKKREINGLALRLIFRRFHRLTVVKVSSCSLTKGIITKIRILCFVLINSVPLNLLCVWIRFL